MNNNQLRFTMPEAKSLERTAGTCDDGVGTIIDDVVNDVWFDLVVNNKEKDDVVEMQGSDRVSDAIATPIAASRGASTYRGVYWTHSGRKFQAQIWHNNKLLCVGLSADAKEAAFMRDRAWRDLGKDPSKLNFDDTVTIPDEYLASVAEASKKVASHTAARAAAAARAAVPPPPPPIALPPPPPPLQQSAQPSSHAIIAAPTAASSPGYRGVYWIERDRVFHAQIKHNYKALYVGASADAKEAAFMRDRAWRDLGKNPNLLNFDDTVPIPNEYLASVANASKKVASHVVQQTAQQPSSVAIAAPSAEEAATVLERAAPSSSGVPVPDGPAHGSAEHEHVYQPTKLSRLIKMLVLHSGLPPDKLSACLVAATDATKVQEISEDVGRLIDVFERESLAETKAALAKATASFFLL